MNTINEIIALYKDGELDLNEANAALEEAGAGFHLDPNETPVGWSREEMGQGFFAPECWGFAPKPTYMKAPDLRRRTDLAGQTVLQKTQRGQFYVSYDEDGYVEKSTRTVPEDRR